jgi:hypothetical protein
MAILTTMKAKWYQRAMEKTRRSKISKLSAASEEKKIAGSMKRVRVA